ncbi:hypothetical protein C8A05DRAFT_44076 [Staphylotrichum tortipilum]|uniref:Uncharacterized protein n=1 Tax=Staphylotrichum tortipilum TaxID=2831512 RepID=A0AAN6MMD1_9PEZI|nr:hypothetical protein C8A05DRAFT_44076 [Staphylotrichum longicolle]
MDALAAALGRIPAIAWGEIAMGFLGVGFLFNTYMLVLENTDFGAAVDALHRAGFRDAPWSMAGGHRNIDVNSTRFLFPAGTDVKERAVLLRASYAHISLCSTLESRFSHEVSTTNIFYPDKELLLESFAKDDGQGAQTRPLMVDDDVLDSTSDDEAKAWFDAAIRKHSDGIDGTTTKLHRTEGPASSK